MWKACVVDPPGGFLIEPLEEHDRIKQEAIHLVSVMGLFSTKVDDLTWTISHEHVVWKVWFENHPER